MGRGISDEVTDNELILCLGHPIMCEPALQGCLRGKVISPTSAALAIVSIITGSSLLCTILDHSAYIVSHPVLLYGCLIHQSPNQDVCNGKSL